VCASALAGGTNPTAIQMLELASGVMLSLLKKDPAYAAVRQRVTPAAACAKAGSQAVTSTHMEGIAGLARHASGEVRTNAVGLLGAVGSRVKNPAANAVRPQRGHIPERSGSCGRGGGR
jgi:hypothetical protein